MQKRRQNRWIILVLLLALIWPGAGSVAAGAEQGWPPLELSVTGQTSDDGITTVYIQLFNKQEAELAELTVIGTLPAGAEFVDSEMISAANPGKFNGSAIEFQIAHLSGRTSLGPLAYRFRAAGASEDAQVFAWAKWNRPMPGTAISSRLNLAVLNYFARTENTEIPWAERFAPFFEEVEQKEGRVGLMIYDLRTGQNYGYNQRELFTPASNVKLLTAAAALDALGADYQFRTVVAYDGVWDDNGILSGNLRVKGYGDPTLTTETLSKWAGALAAAGLKQVQGDILVDDTFFEDEDGETGWGWLIGEEYYAPQTGALSVNINQITLFAIPGETAGAPSWVRVEPALGRQVVHNNVATAAAGQSRYITIDENDEGIIVVEGQAAAGAGPLTKEVSARDPALYTGVLLGKLLEDRGVVFPAESAVRREAFPGKYEIVIDYRSAPLSRIVVAILKDSDNFISEQILRTMGAQVMNLGSAQGGQQVIARFLESNGLSGMPYILCDGCGLRLDNELSPEMIVGVLVLMTHQSYRDVFWEALSIVGVDGTMASRLKDTPAQGNVYAKTGSLLGASALSGYAVTPEGRELAFAILMNGPVEDDWPWVHTMRRIQDSLLLSLFEPVGT